MKTRSKFNVAKDRTDRTYDGIVFDSALEMRYYRDIILPLKENGEVVVCQRQKLFELQPAYIKDGKKVLPITYKADFFVKYKDGREEVIDIKGFADAVAKFKRKMFWYVFPNIDYNWIGYSKLDGGWVLYEQILAGRKTRKRMKTYKEIKDE